MYFVASRACIERVCKKGASERERGGGRGGRRERARVRASENVREGER